MWSIVFMFNEFDGIRIKWIFNKQMMEKILYPNHPLR